MVKNHTWVTCPYCKQGYWLNNIWLDEPEDRVEKLKKLYCPNNAGHIKIMQDDRFNSVTQEKRQEILSSFKSGICVGDVAKKHNVESSVVAEIICRNIQTASYLRTESL